MVNTRMRLSESGGAVLFFVALTYAASMSAAEAARTSIVFVQAPVVAAGDLANRFPQGSRLVRLAPGTNSGSPVNLTSEFFAAADPQVSHDGAGILFAGRKSPEAHWQIWEMNADGSAKRQLTQCSSDCVRPAYLARDEIVFTALSGEGPRRVSRLWVMKRDGSNLRGITFGPGDFQVETVLRDGRILVSARSPLVASHAATAPRDLYTIRPDGTALASFRCDHPRGRNRTQAEELDDGSVIFVKTSQPESGSVGELAEIRRGALHNSRVSPPRSALLSPRRLDRDTLIVARQDSLAGSRTSKFQLYKFDTKTRRFEGKVFGDPKLSSLQAVPLAARPEPKWYWSTLRPDHDAGYFLCLNGRLSQDAPGGRFGGEIRSVRVLALDEGTEKEHTLGEAPVERDGSFYAALPADLPVRFELLGLGGRVIHAQRSWIWARPGEERGCVGCHDEKVVAPENHWPLALRRFDTPTRLGLGARAQAAH